jgi:exopolyphosphatase/guanosine-5'-triphosphate,3'-diphosphate pyrophosphatase
MTPDAPAAAAAKVGVIDIGSNSIRLVAFDLRRGLPLPLFNEKVICRLGQGLVKSGRLAPERTRQALQSLARFGVLAEALALERLFVLATAAVRAASDGEAFMRDVERLLGTQARILDGEEEARFAALGVLSGLPDADGVAGDLGGGSLELTLLERGHPGPGLSLPLGPLPLMELGGLETARAEIDRCLNEVAWLGALRERTLFAVGGAWRALARAEMARTRYPLHIIHGYTLSRAEAEALSRDVLRAAPAAFAQIPGIARHRAATLPLAALLLARILELGRPKAVTFSAHGLREGYVHHWYRAGLAASEDPLLSVTGWMARESDLNALLPDALMSWTQPLFASDTPDERRLRLAACRLSNIGWSEHPDYRALQAFEAILRVPALPLRHAERAFLALVAIHRYDGDRHAPEVAGIHSLLRPAAQRRARVLGLALRLAYRLSGGAPSLLGKVTLEVDGKRLRLQAPPALRPGDALRRDLASLGSAAGLKGTLEAA